MTQKWKKPVWEVAYGNNMGASWENRRLREIGYKQCAGCHYILPHGDFYPREGEGGIYVTSKCKSCYKLEYENRKDYIRDERRKHRLGVPHGTYDLLVTLYGRKCAICETEIPMGTGADSGQFSIDHDEKTGIVRGLLCSKCNIGIGSLQHDVDVLLKAIKYLQKPGLTVEDILEVMRRREGTTSS